MSFSGGTHSFQEVEPRCVFGKRQVLLPTPRMVKELKGLTQVKASRIMQEKEAMQFCKKMGY
jgi:hypothetical protein